MIYARRRRRLLSTMIITLETQHLKKKRSTYSIEIDPQEKIYITLQPINNENMIQVSHMVRNLKR